MNRTSKPIRAAVIIVLGLLATSWPGFAQTVADLGSAGGFTILGGAAVTSTGASIINGNLGVSPGSAVTGFPPGIVINGSININNGPAATAHSDTVTAYNLLAGEPVTTILTGINLGGLTLQPGVYKFASSALLTGTLKLDNTLNPAGSYVFEIGTTLTTASSSAVLLLGGSDPNVFWQVGSSATIGTGTVFDGNILAEQSISFDPGASLSVGRALAIIGSVTLAGGNQINLNATAIVPPPTNNPGAGIYWNGSAVGALGNDWSSTNWSPDTTGTTTSTLALLAPGGTADVVFSVTSPGAFTPAKNQATNSVDVVEAIASLTVNDPVAVTISGPGLLTISGPLTNRSTITINPGAGLTTIKANIVLGSNSAGVAGITVNNTLGLTINGVISGTKGLTKEGVGTLYLTNANIYTGATTFGLVGESTAGTVQVGNGAKDGSTTVTPTSITPFGATTITVNAPTTLTTDGAVTGNSYTLANNFILAPPLAVNVPTSTAMTLSGNITGVDGLFVNVGAGSTGKLILTGDATGNTYSGPTLLMAGTLQAGNLSGNGKAFSPNSDFALGTGSLLDTNGNSETIASLSGAVGTTVTNSGNGSATLTINDTKSSILGAPPAYEFDGTITDAGAPNTLALVKQGPGTVTLTGANSYSGGTTISAGTLVAGSATSASHTSTALGNGNVINSATLETTATQAGNTGSTTEMIRVKGTYMQAASGALLLQVASSPAPSPSNNSGIAGTNYDTLATTGTALVGGTLKLTFAPASVPSQGQRYVVVQSAAAPVMGQFSNNLSDTSGLPPSYITVTTYNDNFGNAALNNSVIISLLQPFTLATFPGLTGNQNSVGTNVTNALVSLNNGGALAVPAGINKDFFDNIVGGLSLAGASGSQGAALDQLSPQRLEILRNVAFDNYALDTQNLDDELARERNGQGGIDTSGFAFNDSTIGPQLSQIKSRLLAWSPPPESGLLSDSGELVLGGVQMTDSKDMKDLTLQAPLNRWNGFVDGGVDLGNLDSNSDVNKSSYTTGRVRAGIDYRIATTIRVGALFGYGHTDADLDNEGSKAKVDSYTPGLYATYADKKGFYANGLATYTRNEYSTSRNIIIPGVNRTASGSTGGNQFGADVDGGYEFHRKNWTFGPNVGLTYVNLAIDSLNESGAGAANLNINNQSANSLRSRLGGTVRYAANLGSIVLTPHASAFWQHEFLNGSTPITSAFQGLPGGTFSVQTPRGDSDTALLGFGIDAELNKTVTIFVDYQAEAGGSTFFGQSASAGVKVGF
jgi:autotransporter-associated beta strand protein